MLLLSMSFALPALAQQGVELIPEAQVRPRWEADSGRDREPSTGGVSFITLRSRLGATLRKDDLAVRVVIADVRAFGEETHVRRDFSADGLDVPIATLAWSPGSALLMVGRMQIGLHDERLLGVADWWQSPQSFDGALLRWEPEGWRAEGRALLVREGDLLDFPTSDQARPGVGDAALYTLTVGPRLDPLDADATFVLDHDWELRNTRLTSGVFSKLRGQTLFGRVEAYAQVGEREEQRVRAGMLGVQGTWRPGPASLTLQYDVLSGDRDPEDGVLTAFDPLLGAHHTYYGQIDMAFVRVGGFGDRQGLHDLALKSAVSVGERVDLLLDLHGFFAAVPPEGEPGFLAVEPDFTARARLNPALTLSVGSFVWLPPTDPVEWATWAMLDARL